MGWENNVYYGQSESGEFGLFRRFIRLCTNLFCVFDSINIGKQLAATSHEKHMPKIELQKALILHEENTEGNRISTRVFKSDKTRRSFYF